MKLIIPNFWRQETILSKLLKPVAYLYAKAINWLSFVPSEKVYQPKAKIINVGNITVGGAGKTPVVLSIANIIQNYSKNKIAVLTRGYKGEILGPTMVYSYHNVIDVGDEALMLHSQIPTCVAKDRLAGIKFLENLGYDIIITDDGLQDQRFKKSLTIIVVDSYFGFGNSLTFPAGPLRESLESGIAKADLMVIIGEGKFSYKFPENLPILKASLVSKVLLGEQKFIAFAGIGNPEKFFLSVAQAEGEIAKKITFADHHQYSKKELDDLISLSNKLQAKLITTEKDYVRIDNKYKSQIQVLPVSLIWQDEEELLKRLLSL